MANFYAGLAATASRLLLSKGQSVTFTRISGGVKNPATGETTGQTTSNYTGNGAAFDYNSSEIDGETIQTGDIRLILEAVATTPLIDDTCPIDSVGYRVMSVKATSPAGTPVIYELQLRR